MCQDRDLKKVGRILRFVRRSNCRNLCDVGCRNCVANFYAIRRVYQCQLWFVHDMRNIRLPYISRLEPTEEITAIQVESIIGLCFYVEENNEKYLATGINRLEVE